MIHPKAHRAPRRQQPGPAPTLNRPAAHSSPQPAPLTAENGAPGLSAPELQQLQRTVGNQVVAQALRPAAQLQRQPLLQRTIRVGDSVYQSELKLLAEFLERTTYSYFGPESIYSNDSDRILAQLRVWNAKNVRFEEWYDLIDEMDSFLGGTEDSRQSDAGALIHKVFNKRNIAYAVQGSYAARMHGAPVSAGDIDVLVENMGLVLQVMPKIGMTKTGGSAAVAKWRYTNGADIDTALGSEFGVNISQSQMLGGMNVLNIYQVLLGLVLRPEKRQKEQDAFFWLLHHKGDQLSQTEQTTIANKTPLQTWDKLMEMVNSNF